MKFTEEQLNNNLKYLIFERVNNDLIYLSKKYDFNEVEDKDKIDFFRTNYHPLIKINTFSESEIEKFINLKKERFIKSVGLFDIDTFIDLNNLDYRGVIDNIHLAIKIIDKGKSRVEGCIDDIYFLCFKYPNDIKMTLFEAEKNLTQLKVYFKILLKTIYNILNRLSDEAMFPKPYEVDSNYEELFKPKDTITKTKKLTNTDFEKYSLESSESKLDKNLEDEIGFKTGSFNYGKLSVLKQLLIDSNLIAKNTDLKDFRRVFIEKKITNKIVWEGNINELYYFISALLKEEFIKNNLDNKWVKTCYCFISENNKDYLPKQFNNVKKGQIGEKVKKRIEKIVNSLK
jgi:hypothetical protein